MKQYLTRPASILSDLTSRINFSEIGKEMRGLGKDVKGMLVLAPLFAYGLSITACAISWNNTRQERRDLVQQIERLADQYGNNDGTLDSSELVDVYHRMGFDFRNDPNVETYR
jgi:hypothetical protein